MEDDLYMARRRRNEIISMSNTNGGLSERIATELETLKKFISLNETKKYTLDMLATIITSEMRASKPSNYKPEDLFNGKIDMNEMMSSLFDRLGDRYPQVTVQEWNDAFKMTMMNFSELLKMHTGQE